MNNALMVCHSHVVDEEKQTEEMIAELNRQSRLNRLNRNSAEAEMLEMRMAYASKAYRTKRINKKWNAVKQVAHCTLCTAALYGFEQLGLPHGISITGMLLLLCYAAVISVTAILGDVFWTPCMKRKGDYR